MRVRILTSKSATNNPRRNMARLATGCTLVRRKNSGWRHLNSSKRKMCPHPLHWDFNAQRDPETRVITKVTHSPSCLAQDFAKEVSAELDRVITETPKHTLGPIVTEIAVA